MTRQNVHTRNENQSFDEKLKNLNLSNQEALVLKNYFSNKLEFSAIARKMNISELRIYDHYISAMKKITHLEKFLDWARTQ